jgi:RNA polymerase sigma factor (sigma-70 family)
MSAGALTLPRDASRHRLLSALPDERLAKLAAQGSAPAFAAIYKRHYQDVYLYCRSILGNEQDARDALQEAMIKALRALQGETREIALRPWLFRIAHNEAVTMLRRRRPSTPLDEITELPAADADAEARESLRELLEDLGQLTPRQRGALVMRELNGLGFDEIAAAMETSPAAAKQTVYEARLALHELSQGRETDCRDVRARISALDRRLLRGRRIRAHLKSCSDCRAFEAAIATRGHRLAAVAPLPAPVAIGILHQILGAGGGGGGGVAAATAGASLTAMAKLGVAGVVALGVGAVAMESRHESSANPPAAEASAPSFDPASARSQSPSTGAAHSISTPHKASGKEAEGGGKARHERGGSSASDQAGGGGGGAKSGAQVDATPSPASASQPSSQPVSENTGQSDSTAPEPSDPSSTDSRGPASTQGHGPTGTPPGHGGVPPGQGGTPPGLGAPPPGHGGTPPGQSTTPPGQSTTPPGQGGTPPGQSTTPPGQSQTPPGHNGGGPPGHG